MTFADVIGYVQANLDADLSLDALAARAAMSPFHFHRRFKSANGVTVARFVERLRLQRAAHELLLHDCRIVDVAFACGYASHETFSRAFKRCFRLAPNEFRARGTLAASCALPGRRSVGGDDRFELSGCRIQYLREVDLLTMRHRGGYDRVPEVLWTRLMDFATRHRLRPSRLLGIGHDPADAASPRFDAAVVVGQPFRSSGRYRHARLPRGPYALTSHVGAYSTLSTAFPLIVAQAVALPGYALVGLPAIEVYHAATMDAAARRNQTDIYLPIVATHDAGATPHRPDSG